MRRPVVFAALLASSITAGCGPLGPAPAPAVRAAVFSSDATPPVGHPLIGNVPLQVVDEPLLLKGIILDDGIARCVLCALDWCTLEGEYHRQFRLKIARAAETPESAVALQCVHTHSAPSRRAEPGFFEEMTDRAGSAAREALGRLRRVTHVGCGKAKVEMFASNRRVPGRDGKIVSRWSSTKDPALRDEPEGFIDPWLRTVTFFDGETPIARMHYYASHPQSHYRDGRVHADVPGWARSRLEREEGAPQIYFTGCAGDVTAGKYNDGSPEARAAMIDRLAAAMRKSAAGTRKEPVSEISWEVRPVDFAWKTDPKSPDPPGRRHPVEIGLLRIGSVDILHLPGEPFVEYQVFAQNLRPDRFVVVAGYGDGEPGYICTDAAFDEGGYEPTASRVGPPSESRLKAAMADLLKPRNP